MWSRVWRFVLVLVLLAAGAGTALSGWRTSRQIIEIDRSERDLSDRIDGLLATLDSITHPIGADSPRDSSLIDRLRSETEAVRPHLRSIAAGRALQDVSASVATLHDIESRAQEHIRLGQELMAADVVAVEGRPAEEAAASGLRTLRSAEIDAYAIARAGVLDSMWTVTSLVGVIWIGGLALLARRPPSVGGGDEQPSATASLSLLAPSAVAPEPSAAPPPDLQVAADVCTAIGRLTSAEDLPQLLQRAAGVLNASGVVIWMAAGEELFAAAACGYPAQVIRKLGPINRSAINATAAAWRTGTLQAVSSDHGERGALAVPMLGPDRCVGVLAVEVAAGHDGHAATRAVTMMFAAQLAAALAGWPAASAAAPVEVPPRDAVAAEA